MEAMHGLCVECHEAALAEAADEYPADLARCGTCHDPDRREQLQRLEPRRTSVERTTLAGGAKSAPSGD